MATSSCRSDQQARAQRVKQAENNAGIDPVYHDRQPASARHAVTKRQETPQEIEMRLAPNGDGLILIAVGDGPAHGQQRQLRHWKRQPTRLARVLNPRKMVQKQPQTRRQPQNQTAKNP
jgi:hypothetical protein